MPASSYVLPSGARVTFSSKAVRLEAPGPFDEELHELRARFRAADGSKLAFDQLSLADFHTFRAIAKKLELAPERTVSHRCRNCNHDFSIKPCSTLELGPFADDELDDPKLDAAFDFSVPHPIPPIREGEAETSKIRLAPRTLGQAAPLHRALRFDRPLRITSKVAAALGVIEIDGETSPKKIARAIANAPDDAYLAIQDLFEDAHYPLRLEVPHACPECGVVEWLPVPMSREFHLEPPDGELLDPLPPELGDFPDIDAFEEIVRDEAALAYAALGVRGVDLSVIEGAAECDDSGEPLLGCYRPPEPEGLVPHDAEIRVFYRTFANEWADYGPYDVREEIAETIRHELEHHVGYLAGDDPLDDDERDEIDREVARRVGRREVGRRAARALGTDLRDFFARTWLVWLIVLAATLLAVQASR